MAFIIWLYITGYILIIGAEINAIFHNYKVEHRIFEETHTKEQFKIIRALSLRQLTQSLFYIYY